MGIASARPRDERGAAAVEFGIIAVLLFTLLFGTMQLGLWLLAWETAGHAAREGARVAAVNPCSAAVAATALEAIDAVPGEGKAALASVPAGVGVGDEVTVRVTLTTLDLGFVPGFDGVVDKSATTRVEYVRDGELLTWPARGATSAAPSRCCSPCWPSSCSASGHWRRHRPRLRQPLAAPDRRRPRGARRCRRARQRSALQRRRRDTAEDLLTRAGNAVPGQYLVRLDLGGAPGDRTASSVPGDWKVRWWRRAAHALGLGRVLSATGVLRRCGVRHRPGQLPGRRSDPALLRCAGLRLRRADDPRRLRPRQHARRSRRSPRTPQLQQRRFHPRPPPRRPTARVA